MSSVEVEVYLYSEGSRGRGIENVNGEVNRSSYLYVLVSFNKFKFVCLCESLCIV